MISEVETECPKCHSAEKYRAAKVLFQGTSASDPKRAKDPSVAEQFDDSVSLRCYFVVVVGVSKWWISMSDEVDSCFTTF